MNVLWYPYKRGLNSTSLVNRHSNNANPVGVRYVDSTVPRRAGRVAISWGNSILPAWHENVEWINHPNGIGLVCNKGDWAKFCYDNSSLAVPEFTTSSILAQQWLDEGEKVLARTILNGKGGAGIVTMRPGAVMQQAPLYTKYVNKQREYRLIVSVDVEGTATLIHATSKRRSDSQPVTDSLIRTMENGWVFQNEDIESIPTTVEQAVCGVAFQLKEEEDLSILAYDVGYNTNSDTAVVYEANSAWGMNELVAERTTAELERLRQLMVA